MLYFVHYMNYLRILTEGSFYVVSFKEFCWVRFNVKLKFTNYFNCKLFTVFTVSAQIVLGLDPPRASFPILFFSISKLGNDEKFTFWPWTPVKSYGESKSNVGFSNTWYLDTDFRVFRIFKTTHENKIKNCFP